MSQHTVGKHCVNLDKLGVNYTHDWKSAEEHILLIWEINGWLDKSDGKVA